MAKAPSPPFLERGGGGGREGERKEGGAYPWAYQGKTKTPQDFRELIDEYRIVTEAHRNRSKLLSKLLSDRNPMWKGHSMGHSALIRSYRAM